MHKKKDFHSPIQNSSDHLWPGANSTDEHCRKIKFGSCLTEGKNNLDLSSVSGVAVFVQDDLWMRVWLLLLQRGD